MNRIQFESRSHQASASPKSESRWGRLTEEELHEMLGKEKKKEMPFATVALRYGALKTEAEKRLDEWLARSRPWVAAPKKTEGAS